jgi:chromosome segregation ATPase
MADLQEEMDNALANRNEQNKEFKDALKADADAVMLLAKTIEALSKYYVKNGLALSQKKKHLKKHRAGAHKQPEYTVSDETAPSADFSSATSSSSENSGIVSIIENIKEDLEKEMETSKKDESESFASYRKMLKESADSMQAMKDKVISLKEEIADTGKKIEDEQDVWNDLHAQKQAVDAYLDSIKEQCDWIMSNFDSRATARKEEMEGLDDAKSALAGGAAPGSFVVKHNVVTKTKESVADQLKELDATERSYKFLQK